MIIETIREPAGFSPAMHGMRNPKDSWLLSDSEFDFGEIDEPIEEWYVIGPKDQELSEKLQKAGPEHCKHTRMIFVWADITAPLYWHKQLDTYRIGVEKISCSTMHKLGSRLLTPDDFEHDSINTKYFSNMLENLNGSIEAYQLCKDPDHKQDIWRGIVQALPECYLQKRTVCFSYAALRNIVRQRMHHKLPEWEYFCRWAKSLPNSWMIFDEGENK